MRYLLLLLCTAAASAGEIRWETDYRKALDLAKKSQRMVFVFFSSPT